MRAVKKLLLLLLILTVLALAVGCGGGTDDRDTDSVGDKDEGNGDMKESLYYKSIILGDLGGVDPDARSIVNKYQKAKGKRLAITELGEITTGHIILGKIDCPISKDALKALEAYRAEGGFGAFDMAYAILFRDGNAAVVWESHAELGDVTEALLNAICADTPPADGECILGKTEMCGEMIRNEQAEREQKLKAVEDALGVEVKEAVIAHLSLATEDYYKWLAGLYVPRKCICDNYDEDGYRICLHPKGEDGKYLCTGGGFYYSNSARDTDGYEIDLESTIQAMSFASSSGMLKSMAEFDRQIGLDAAAFAKSLQSLTDGYFYHPQWGSAITDSRKGRDLDWATKLLTNFGVKPFVNTPSGLQGELGLPTGFTDRLSASRSAAVSRAVAAAQVWPEHLSTLSAFLEYLDSFDLATKSYSAGNTLTAQASQILARDKEGIASGELTDSDGDGIADNGFVNALKSYLDLHQNKENGLWEDSVHYDSVNGLMKISSCYNKLGIPMQNTSVAFASAVEIINIPAGERDIKGRIAAAAVDVFNPWIAIIELMSNIHSFGDEGDILQMKDTLKRDAANMIRNTTEKTKKFAKEDGSFGYTWSTSPYKSQGAPVCPEGIVEGDVNGGGIALNGIWLRISAALDIPISIFSPSDGVKFNYLLKKKCENAN